MIKKRGNVDLETGDILPNMIVEVAYDGTYFQMNSQVATITIIDIESQTEKTDETNINDEFLVRDSVDVGNKRIKY